LQRNIHRLMWPNYVPGHLNIAGSAVAVVVAVAVAVAVERKVLPRSLAESEC
jgi:hypothetical protein